MHVVRERYDDATRALAELSAAAGRPAQVETATTRESFLQASQLVGRDYELDTLEGALDLTVRRRVVTNGSIYIDMAQLTLGQQVLLGLPDEANELVATDGGTAYRAGVVGTFAPDTAIDDQTELDLDITTHLAVRQGGLAMLPRTIRYIEDRRAEERRFTGAIEEHPAPVGVVWGDLDPVAAADRQALAHPAASSSRPSIAPSRASVGAVAASLRRSPRRGTRPGRCSASGCWRPR